jgi:2-phosphosulfolactate phosphatase
MHIDCIFYRNGSSMPQMNGKTVIVIDVLRATTTMTTALANGATAIIPVETISEAHRLAKSDDVLAGERDSRLIAGFALSNSPLEFTRSAVNKRTIVMTTTNGTRVMQRAMGAATLLAGALINAKACGWAALKFKSDIILLCAGAEDHFALEDGLCAGMLIAEMREAATAQFTLTDFAAAMEGAYLGYANRLNEVLLTSDGGKRLSGIGLQEDVLFCSRKNTHSAVPVWRDGAMRPFLW